MQNLNDSYADAQAEVNKAQQALNETVIVSDVSGTVVEVNNDIDPSSKNSQTLVHVATEGQLQIKGTLTEYDLANIKTGQNVKIKSKVYPDQEWTVPFHTFLTTQINLMIQLEQAVQVPPQSQLLMIIKLI